MLCECCLSVVSGCWRVLAGVGGCWRVLVGVGRCWWVFVGVLGVLVGFGCLKEKTLSKKHICDGRWHGIDESLKIIVTFSLKIGCPSHSSLVLYSQPKGVKQKYILCISGLVAYRQYIHNCNGPEDSY